MRIISQNKDVDVPYDYSTLLFKEVEYRCINSSDIIYKYKYMFYTIFENQDLHIGTYETKECCIEIMNEIRQSANSGETYYYMPEERF